MTRATRVHGRPPRTKGDLYERRRRRRACGLLHGTEKDARQEDKDLCDSRRDAQRACKLLGRGATIPPSRRAQFMTTAEPDEAEPVLPLNVGYKWVYGGGGEVDTIEVQNATKLLEGGVRCIVVVDRVERAASPPSSPTTGSRPQRTARPGTAARRRGSTRPSRATTRRCPELVNIDGSFKAGRDGDKSRDHLPGAPEGRRTCTSRSSRSGTRRTCRGPVHDLRLRSERRARSPRSAGARRPILQG
jgi:hypothetical protein